MPKSPARNRKRRTARAVSSDRIAQSRTAVAPRAATEQPVAVPAEGDENEPVSMRQALPRKTQRDVRPYQSRHKSIVVSHAPSSISTLPREQEYAFIRADLQRLLVIAGTLTVVMIALLFVIER